MASDASFIFSAGSYDAARSRVRWLRQLSRWQADKARQVNEEAAALEVRRQRLDSLSVLLKSSLDSLSTERRVLAGRRDKADAAVGQLKKAEPQPKSASSSRTSGRWPNSTASSTASSKPSAVPPKKPHARHAKTAPTAAPPPCPAGPT